MVIHIVLIIGGQIRRFTTVFVQTYYLAVVPMPLFQNPESWLGVKIIWSTVHQPQQDNPAIAVRQENFF